MKKLYRTLAFLIVPLFALRLYDTLANIDPKSGYFKNGFNVFYLLSLVIIAAAFIWISIKNKKSETQTNAPVPDGLTAVTFGICSVFTFVSSIFLLAGVFKRTEFRYIFMSKRALFDQNITDTHFRIEFWLAALGFAAAVWFAFAAYRFFKTGNLSGYPLFCAVPVAWFCLRALCDYSISPVNPNNTIILTSLLADLILALFYLRFLRFASFSYPETEAKKPLPYAFLAFVFVISLKAPLLIIKAPASLADAFLMGVDIFASIAAFTAAGLLIKGDKDEKMG